jgi:hypothetical protein
MNGPNRVFGRGFIGPKVGGHSMPPGRGVWLDGAMPLFPSRRVMQVLAFLLAGAAARASIPVAEPAVPGSTLRVLASDLLEIELIQVKATEGTMPWNLLIPSGAVRIPAAAQFAVTVEGAPVGVTAVGFKRRAVSAPLGHRDLRVGTWIYLRLAQLVGEGREVKVTNPGRDLWAAETIFQTRADPLRESPVIHVNQEGYVPTFPKKARVGYYLGSLGEMAPPADDRFRLVDPAGATVFEGRLTRQIEKGTSSEPAPYQQVYEADFSAFTQPGRYRLVVPGIGASPAFYIDDGVAIGFARAYALGIYHQRCGTSNALPFSRFVHGDCHMAPASVPSPQSAFPFTWSVLAKVAGEAKNPAPGSARSVTDEAAQLYPFVHRGNVDVSGGHHDAGDYSKYTTNSATFIHCLVFAVDSMAGAADCDNLGLPESGDGISDLLQEAKWEADFLAKMQDDDGGFYFLVYPRDRRYEIGVLPDHGDPQVIWPKNTAATAAAVAALAQAASSPAFRKAWPAVAADYLARAEKGWAFLLKAIASHGKAGAYQRLTHYGDNHGHDDELAWAAAELFLATGRDEYHKKFREWCDPANASLRRWGWWRLNESWGHAIRSYAFGVRSGRVQVGQVDARLVGSCEREIEAAGRDALRWSQESAYGTSFPTETKRMRGGGWYFSLDQAFDLAVASQLDYPRANDPRPQFLEAFVANLDHEAGVNPVNLSYITGVGQRRPRQMVHQYAESDRRAWPPSGLPIGNLQAGQPYLPPYQGELGALSYPEDGAATAPYPYYDRWTDTHNVSMEFVIANQARALAGLAWLAGRTEAGRRPWRAATAEITGLPAKAGVGDALAAQLRAPEGFDLSQAEIVWEAAGGQTGQGEHFSFKSAAHGRLWVEAEANWPDGRRLSAVAEVIADNGLPNVTVTALTPVTSVGSGPRGVFRFHRTGDLSRPLKVRFDLQGSATKWNDYRREEGDMPVEVTIPAKRDSVTLTILPIAAGLGANSRHVQLVLASDPAYNRAAPHAAVIALRGKGAPPPPPAPALPELKN